MAQYVMSMLRVSKIVPPKRQIIKDISLSFFPGAKIGLLGLNGSGKSTVLKIMAGADKEFEGEVQHQPNISIGYLEQEPHLDAEKTVREEVESAMGEVIEARTKLEAVYAAYAEPDMLLLDEPTNHLDAESVEWLEQFLVRFPGTVVAVTHDRYFLDNAAEWILE